MLFNYLKVTLRQMRKSSGYTLVNLTGLATGLACYLLILLFVLDELRYDRSHANFDEIYRITTYEEDAGNTRHIAHAFAPLADLIETGIEEVQACVRVLPHSTSVRHPDSDIAYQEGGVIYADSLFFDLFTYTFVAGSERTALHAPNAVVMTTTMAERYFGDANPIGQTIILSNDVPCEVTGLIEPPPTNTSLRFDMIVAMPAVRQVIGDWALAPYAWYHPPMYTYVQVGQADIGRVEANMPLFEKTYLSEKMDERYDFSLQPLSEVHFEALQSDLSPAIKRVHLAAFGLIALLILTIACFNYVNLSLAKILHRLKGMGVRKILGAQNRHILYQVGVDSVVHLVIGLVTAGAIVSLALPLFNRVVGKEMHLTTEDPSLWGSLLGVTLLSAAIISLFLYFNLQRRDAVALLGQHGRTQTARKGIQWNQSFVIFQFVIAIGLIMATGIVRQQMRYIQTMDIGLDSEQLLVLPIRDDEVQNNYQAVKNELVGVPGVLSVSAISNFPWETGFYDFPSTIKGMAKDIEANLPTLIVDRDFMSTMQIEIMQGRGFHARAPGGRQTFLINQAIASQYGIDQLEGLQLDMVGLGSDDALSGEIVGITKDFHLKSLHHPVDPLVITTAPAQAQYFLDNFVVRISPQAVLATLASLSERWQELVPMQPFDYFFLDEAFGRLYQKEQRMRYLFNVFALLAVAIACLGLLALAAYNAQQRTKEIGIRKVLGANTMQIISLLSRDFVRMILVAILLAVPVVWFAMSRWLEEFAYRTVLDWWIFACAAFIVLILAVASVCIQALRVARANPVKAVQTE